MNFGRHGRLVDRKNRALLWALVKSGNASQKYATQVQHCVADLRVLDRKLRCDTAYFGKAGLGNTPTRQKAIIQHKLHQPVCSLNLY